MDNGLSKQTDSGVKRRVGQFRTWLGDPIHLGLCILFFALVIAVLGYINQNATVYIGVVNKRVERFVDAPLITDFYANLSTELASIAVTILIVDSLYRRRNEEQEKQELILQMGSHYNAFAREAIRKLRKRQWLFDEASMNGADLGRANLRLADLDFVTLPNVILEGADLRGANLENAKLRGVNLSNADLSKFTQPDGPSQQTNLTNADLTGATLLNTNLKETVVADEQLAKTRRLQGATMPSGKRYNGRFNLEDDLLQAHFIVGSTHPQAMAQFYGVPEEVYRWGQEWYQTCWNSDPPEMYSPDLPRWYQLNEDPDGPRSRIS